MHSRLLVAPLTLLGLSLAAAPAAAAGRLPPPNLATLLSEGTVDALAGSLRGYLVRSLPPTLYESSPGWGRTIRVANGIRYGLSSSIYTRDVNKAFRAMRDLVTGITYINAGTIGAEIQLPFGGTKYTGNGHREAGTAALDTYTEWKSVYVDYSGKLQRAQIDNQPS